MLHGGRHMDSQQSYRCSRTARYKAAGISRLFQVLDTPHAAMTPEAAASPECNAAHRCYLATRISRILIAFFATTLAVAQQAGTIPSVLDGGNTNAQTNCDNLFAPC